MEYTDTPAEIDEDDKTIGHIWSRRELIAALGGTGLAALLLAGCGSGSGSGSVATTSTTGSTTGTSGVTPTGGASETTGTTTTTTTTTGTTTTSAMDIVATPAVTEGPFFVDEKLNRSDLIAGTTRASVANGVPLALQVNVFTISGGVATPLSGATVDVWHADAVGSYSDEASGQIQRENTSGQTWLRGYQVSDISGAATFGTIYPGWYQGRTTHIHFKVRTYSADGTKTHEFTSQLFFDDTLSDAIFANAPYNGRGTRGVRNANDNVYTVKQTDGTTAGSHLLLALAQSGTGYTGTFNIGLVF